MVPNLHIKMIKNKNWFLDYIRLHMTFVDVFSIFGEIYWSLIHLIGTEAYKFVDGDNIVLFVFKTQLSLSKFE